MKRRIVHSFAPIIGAESEILILGSVPSVKSVEYGFYYMHPQNRFWRLMSVCLGQNIMSVSPEEKTECLLKNRVALYDAVYKCDITGSADSGATSIVPTDIVKLIADTKVEKVLCNGALSYKIATKYNAAAGVRFIKMPSTSPANAAMNLETLVKLWMLELRQII
jgi:hypoxanthine-DNA glycosylase